MPLSTFQTDIAVLGNLSVNSISLPANSVNNAAVQTPSPASQGIAATKVLHLVVKEVTQVPTTAVVAATNLCHVVIGSSCTIQGVQVMTTTPPTSSDTVTVDVRKASAGLAFATILSSTIGLSSTTAARTVVNGTLSTTTANPGDVFETVVTVSGTSCQGLIISLVLYESAI